MRVAKYLSISQICSRREAERLILAGRVKVNGVTLSDFKYDFNPEIDRVEVEETEKKITYAYHKPRGISSSKIYGEGKNIFDLVPEFKNLSTVGRLDKESEGLILLTNDGLLARSVTGEDHLVEKEYIVGVREVVTQTKMNAMSQGMILEDGPTLPCQAELIDNHQFRIILKEGRNHQIRRMCNKVRLTVTKLVRVRVGQIRIANLEAGKYRTLSSEEIKNLRESQ